MRYDNEGNPYVVVEHKSGRVGGFLLGAAVGVGLALLFAPHSGRVTRRVLARRVRRVGGAAERVVGGAVSEAVESVRDRVEHQVDRVRQTIDFRKEQVNRAVLAGRAAANEARVDLERRIAASKEGMDVVLRGGDLGEGVDRTP
jgi:gas vesicle protein